MKNLACRDIGGECDFVASGETADEVKRAMYDHAGQTHPELLANMDEQEKEELEELMDKMLA